MYSVGKVKHFSKVSININIFLTALVVLDLSKAFDTLSHNLLLFILHVLGFSLSSIMPIKEYLTDRCQYMFLDDMQYSI